MIALYFNFLFLICQMYFKVSLPNCNPSNWIWLQDGIEECRKLCGGHGYLCSSGLPELFAVYVPACTYEGDNIVLLLQVFQNEISILLFHIKCKYIVELWAIQCALSVCFGSEEDLPLNIWVVGNTFKMRLTKYIIS